MCQPILIMHPNYIDISIINQYWQLHSSLKLLTCKHITSNKSCLLNYAYLITTFTSQIFEQNKKFRVYANQGNSKVNPCKKSCPFFISIRPLIVNHKSPRYDIVIKRKLIRCHLNNNYITIDFITQSIINKIIEHLN
jgi:hypothetical protein